MRARGGDSGAAPREGANYFDYSVQKTIEGSGQIAHVRPSSRVLRAALLCLAGGFALGAAGCWASALQFAPLGIQVAEQLGAGAVHMAGNAASNAHHNDAEDEDKEEDKIDEQGELCDELQLQAPSIVEFRSTTGVDQYRALGLAGLPDAPKWTAPADKTADASGWQPAVNFTKMEFDPPLPEALAAVHNARYLAFAPADAHDTVERDQLVSLTVDFGPTAGTFRFNGRAYEYAVLRRLPCFPKSSP